MTIIRSRLLPSSYFRGIRPLFTLAQADGRGARFKKFNVTLTVPYSVKFVFNWLRLGAVESAVPRGLRASGAWPRGYFSYLNTA